MNSFFSFDYYLLFFGFFGTKRFLKWKKSSALISIDSKRPFTRTLKKVSFSYNWARHTLYEFNNHHQSVKSPGIGRPSNTSSLYHLNPFFLYSIFYSLLWNELFVLFFWERENLLNCRTPGQSVPTTLTQPLPPP